MTSHRCAAGTRLTLGLLLLLAACMPASPVAPAATATLVAPAPPPATVTPAPTPTPLPQPQLRRPADSRFSPVEQATLQARIATAPAEWGITPDMDLMPDRGNNLIYLIAINRADEQPIGRIIVLEAITATQPLAIADLTDARALAQGLGLTVEAITVGLVPPDDGQVVGVDAEGKTVVVFDVATRQWRPATPPTPEPTATPDAAEALKQHPWEVRYTTGPGGELTAQYYNATTKEVVSVVAPEIENLQKSIWEAPDGRQLIIYQDTANAHGLAKYRYPYNPEAKQLFPEGTIAWLEPKLLVNYPDGQSVRGGIVMAPEFQAQRQAQAPAAEKLQGKWRIGLPFTQAPSKTLASEMALGIWNGYKHILEVDFNTENAVVVVNPMAGKGLTTGYGTNKTDHLAEVKVKNIGNSGFLPATDAEKGFAVRFNEASAFNPAVTVGNQHKTHIGEVLVHQVASLLKPKGTVMNLSLIVTGPNGSWKSFGLHSFDNVAGYLAMTAPSAN